MAISRPAARPRFVLLLVVLTSVTLMVLDGRGGGIVGTVRGSARDAFSPVRGITDAVVRPFGNFTQGVLHYGDLQRENDRLREQLARTQSDRISAADAKRERQELLSQQHLNFAGDIPSVSARVVVQDLSNFEQTVEIDRGTRAGVLNGMPVVAANGLVGRIVEASRNRATVLLLTDPTASVGVRLATSGDVGIASGKGRGANLTVDLVELASSVKAGEPVVTSGLQQSIYPPGVPIGRVDKIAKTSAASLQREMSVTPIVDVDHLSFVRVLQWDSTP